LQASISFQRLARFGPFLTRQDRRFVVLNPSQLDSRRILTPVLTPDLIPSLIPSLIPDLIPSLIPFFGLLFSLPFRFERPRKLLVLFGFLGIAAGFVGFLKFGLQMLFH
jgi:hypothetical protein